MMRSTRSTSILPRLGADLLAAAYLLLLASAPARAAPPSAAVVETGLRLGADFDLGGGRWATAAHVVCGLSVGARVRLPGVGPATVVGRQAEELDLGWEGLLDALGETSGRWLRLPAFGEGFVARLAGAGPGFSGGPLRAEDGRTLWMVVAVCREAPGGSEDFVLPIAAVHAATAGRAHLPPLPC